MSTKNFFQKAFFFVQMQKESFKFDNIKAQRYYIVPYRFISCHNHAYTCIVCCELRLQFAR